MPNRGRRFCGTGACLVEKARWRNVVDPGGASLGVVGSGIVHFPYDGWIASHPAGPGVGRPRHPASSESPRRLTVGSAAAVDPLRFRSFRMTASWGRATQCLQRGRRCDAGRCGATVTCIPMPTSAGACSGNSVARRLLRHTLGTSRHRGIFPRLRQRFRVRVLLRLARGPLDVLEREPKPTKSTLAIPTLRHASRRQRCSSMPCSTRKHRRPVRSSRRGRTSDATLIPADDRDGAPAARRLGPGHEDELPVVGHVGALRPLRAAHLAEVASMKATRLAWPSGSVPSSWRRCSRDSRLCTCSGWVRTQCPGGNQGGTFRLRRWTFCFG